eukprot:7838180-Pyramimonas_sp.AAC.1
MVNGQGDQHQLFFRGGHSAATATRGIWNHFAAISEAFGPSSGARARHYGGPHGFLFSSIDGVSG